MTRRCLVGAQKSSGHAEWWHEWSCTTAELAPSTQSALIAALDKTQAAEDSAQPMNFKLSGEDCDEVLVPYIV